MALLHERAVTDVLASSETQTCQTGQVVVNKGGDQWVTWANGFTLTGCQVGVAISNSSGGTLPGTPLTVITSGRINWAAFNIGAGAQGTVVSGKTPGRGTVSTSIIGTCDASGEITIWPSYIGVASVLSPSETDASNYGADPTGSISAVAALVAAYTAALTGSERLHFAIGIYKIDSNITFPKGLTYQFDRGAIFNVSPGITCAFLDTIVADPTAQLFEGSGSVTLTGATFVASGWFGNAANKYTVSDNGSLAANSLIDGATCSSVLGVNHSTSAAIVSGQIDAALRVDMVNAGGGTWDVSNSLTVSDAVAVSYAAGNRGTHEIMSSYMKGLGAGDATPFSCGTDTWGGATPSEGAGSIGIAQSNAIGEFDLAEGGVRYSAFNTPPTLPTESPVNGSVFQATVSGSPASAATVISYTATANADNLGCRFILNSNHTTTTGVVSAVVPDPTNQQTLVTFTGVTWTSAAVGRYLKIGAASDFYTVSTMSGLLGDDIYLNGHGVGHWYRIKANPASNQLMLEGIWDTVAFANAYAALPTASYIVMDGAEIQSFTGTAITVSANTNTWSNGDTLYSPPHHYQDVMGASIILQKLYKTGKTAINASDGIRIVSRGQSPMDYGMRLVGVGTYGGYLTGICMQNFSPQVAIDLSTITSSVAAIRLAQGEHILLDSTASAPYIRGESATGIELIGQTGGYSLFASDGTNSDFIVSHPAVGEIQFVDSTLDTWLTQHQGASVYIGPGGPSAGIAITGTQLYGATDNAVSLGLVGSRWASLFVGTTELTSAGLGGNSSVSGTLQLQATSGGLSTAANIVLSAAQAATPVIQLNNTVKSGGASVTLPNSIGAIWYVDITGVTFSANSLTFTTGSGTSAVISGTQGSAFQTSGKNLLTVVVVASHFVSVG